MHTQTVPATMAAICVKLNVLIVIKDIDDVRTEEHVRWHVKISPSDISWHRASEVPANIGNNTYGRNAKFNDNVDVMSCRTIL